MGERRRRLRGYQLPFVFFHSRTRITKLLSPTYSVTVGWHWGTPRRQLCSPRGDYCSFSTLSLISPPSFVASRLFAPSSLPRRRLEVFDFLPLPFPLEQRSAAASFRPLSPLSTPSLLLSFDFSRLALRRHVEHLPTRRATISLSYLSSHQAPSKQIELARAKSV